MKPAAKSTAFSKVPVKSQTVLPRAVRARLGVQPGDTLRYSLTEQGVMIDKAVTDAHDPFATFCEWAGEADAKAFAKL